MNLRLSILCAGGLALATPVALAAPCPVITLQPKVMTPASRALGPGDGIVVSWHGYWRPIAVPFEDTRATWRFATGKTRASTAPRETVLAPGLSVYLPEPTDTVFEDGKRATIFTVTRPSAALPAKELAAPRIASVIRNAPSRMRHPSVTTTVTLTSVPTTALALVAYAADGTTAGSWGVLDGTSATIYSQTGCNPIAPGTRDWQPGETLRIAWIDGAGRISKLSAAIKVVAAPER